MQGNKRVNERLVTGSLIDAAMESNETGYSNLNVTLNVIIIFKRL